MTDPRIHNMASIILDHSTKVKPGDRVGIRAPITAEPLVHALYTQTLERGGHPDLALELPEEERLLFEHGGDAQLDRAPVFPLLIAEEFDAYIKIRAETNVHSLAGVDPARQARRQKGLAPLLKAQMRRGGEGSLRWLSTLYPTQAYAEQAGMSLDSYQDFVYRACHAAGGEQDPVTYWRSVEAQQAGIIAHIQGRDLVALKGPNVELSLSIKGRRFRNASGQHNLPDGEIYTGPVEESVQGWVRYTYPAIYQGRVVEGVELTFEAGQVIQATARTHPDFLHQMLNTDSGARYVGEFAIGTNFQIDRFTGNILFDEKIGGTFHMALGAGYPETGSMNQSAVHWDMICDMRNESEIRVDGELIYKNGRFSVG